MKLIVGNWKANKNLYEAQAWWKTFSSAKFQKQQLEVVICPPAVYLLELHTVLQKTLFPFPVKLGIQDISEYPGGTYTGEITGRMVNGVASYAILGHSERRKWFGETAQSIARKAMQAIDNDIVPIVSIDRKNYMQQFNQFEKIMLPNVVFMYEPPEAISMEVGEIGEGHAADQSDVEDMVKILRSLAPESKILYGGSVKSHSVNDFLSLPGVDGVVPGTASMNADEFIRLINAS